MFRLYYFVFSIISSLCASEFFFTSSSWLLMMMGPFYVQSLFVCPLSVMSPCLFIPSPSVHVVVLVSVFVTSCFTLISHPVGIVFSLLPLSLWSVISPSCGPSCCPSSCQPVYVFKSPASLCSLSCCPLKCSPSVPCFPLQSPSSQFPPALPLVFLYFFLSFQVTELNLPPLVYLLSLSPAFGFWDI